MPFTCCLLWRGVLGGTIIMSGDRWLNAAGMSRSGRCVGGQYAFALDEPVSTCLWQDIWQVMSLDGLWIQYTQAG
jgi:hypothetical protein